MKKLHKYSIYFLLAVISFGCALLPQPDRFKLDRKSSAPIEGYILSENNLVKVDYNNQIEIFNGGACSIKRPNITISGSVFTVTLRDGDGLRFSTRTDSRKYKDEPGIVFEWTKNGSKIYENDALVASVDSVKAVLDTPTNIELIQDGGYYAFIADCDTVIKSKTLLPSSEYIIIESINSNSKLSGIRFDHQYGFGRDIILEFDEEGNKVNKEKIQYNR